MGGSTIYAFTPPRSRMLMRACTKATAARLVAVGIHPGGSIWIPSPIGERPEIGSLYAPDATWRPADRLSTEGGER